MSKKIKLFFKGIVDILPLLIPVVPFGIILGAIGIELGFSSLEIFATSFIIFGGASQIVFLQLFSSGASSLITITSTFVVNSRHLLYGVSFSEYLKNLSLGWKVLLSYLLTDQAYAVSNNYLKNNTDKNRSFHILGGGVTCWVIWQITTLLGIFLGSIIPEKLGLGFAVPLTFLAIIINDFRKLINTIVIIVSGLIATFGSEVIPFKAYVIVAATIGLLIAMILTKFKKSNNG